MGMPLRERLFRPDDIDLLLVKLLTRNDDSGRHGVLIPTEAYDAFPGFTRREIDSSKNLTAEIKVIRQVDGRPEERDARFKLYERYPERRITRLGSRAIDAAPASSILIVARRRSAVRTYELHLITPDDETYPSTLEELGIISPEPGAFVLLRDWSSNLERVDLPENVAELLARFESVRARGWITSTGSGGDSGVGNTFEMAMGGSINNARGADVLGVELKAMLKGELSASRRSGESDLFLAEPEWHDGTTSRVERVERYGYHDESGRRALYSGVKRRTNAHGLSLRGSPDLDTLKLQHKGADVAIWKAIDLKHRLRTKLDHTLHALAERRVEGNEEQFRYHTLHYLAHPTASRLIQLLERGAGSVQIRMHAGKNHGTQFRVATSEWENLYSVVLTLSGAS